MTRIADVQRLEGMVKVLMRATVAAERGRGRTWEEIGEEMGVTRSAAHSRFANAVDFVGGSPEALRAIRSAWLAIADLANENFQEPPAPLEELPGVAERLEGLEAVVRLLCRGREIVSETALPEAALRLMLNESPPRKEP